MRKVVFGLFMIQFLMVICFNGVCSPAVTALSLLDFFFLLLEGRWRLVPSLKKEPMVPFESFW